MSSHGPRVPVVTSSQSFKCSGLDGRKNQRKVIVWRPFPSPTAKRKPRFVHQATLENWARLRKIEITANRHQ